MASLSHITVVLVRPTEQGNVGATARAMANTGLSQLSLVEPAAPIGDVARAFAVSAGHVLDSSRRFSNLAEALASHSRVVGTTSSRSRQLGIPSLTPRELPPALADDPADQSTALVFGPERSGLTKEELSLCSLLVSVPCAPRQPTLNLSQAVLILAYELYFAQLDQSGSATGASPAAAVGDIDALFTHLEEFLVDIGFARDDTWAGVRRDLRQLTARSTLTEREVQILRGLLRRAGHACSGR